MTTEMGMCLKCSSRVFSFVYTDDEMARWLERRGEGEGDTIQFYSGEFCSHSHTSMEWVNLGSSLAVWEETRV